MAEAAVLKTGEIIQTTGFGDKSFYITTGRLASFTKSVNDVPIKYSHCVLSDFKPDDKERASAGYYDEKQFLNYRAGKVDFQTLNTDHRLSDYTYARDGDIVKVEKLNVPSPPYATSFPKWHSYSIKFTRKEDILPKLYGNIVIPSGATLDESNANLIPAAKAFFSANISHANATGITPEEQKKRAWLIIYISYYVNHINRDLFSLLTSDTLYQQLITLQNAKWATNIFVVPTYDDIYRYYNLMFNFYNGPFLNQVYIQDAPSTEKLYWLARCMSASSLTIINYKTKLDLLLFLINNKLSINVEKSVDENLVVNIIHAFNTGNLNEIDPFLEGLLKFVDEKSPYTIFHALDIRMSTDWNITQGLISLSNWVFNTSYKPTDTRGAFMRGVYALWQFSKYCPYDDEGNIKPNTIGVKTINNATSTFTPDNGTYLFRYSNDIANAEQTDHTYKVVRPDATPMVIPYESEKTLGIYWDNFNFKYIMDSNNKFSKIHAFEDKTVRIYYTDEEDFEGTAVDGPVLYGVYDIFQPVSLLNINIETKQPIPTIDGQSINVNGQNINSFIPIFILKFIDDSGDNSDTETMIGYLIDGALTISGVGNLAKLRHLKWVATGGNSVKILSAEGFSILMGTVEFTSGVLGFLSNFIECSEDNEFCKRIKTFIFVLGVASFSAGSIASLVAKRQGKRVFEAISDEVDDAATKKSKLADALGGGSEADDAAETMYEFVYMVVHDFTSNAYNVSVKVFNKIQKAIKLTGKELFQINYFDLEALKEIIAHLSTKVHLSGKQLENLCADFVFIASNIDKKITKSELIDQITFFYDIVLIRKFPSGFIDFPQFKQFCNAARNSFSSKLKFWDDALLDSIDWWAAKGNKADWKNFNFQERVELVVQGSAIRKTNPGDIDIGLMMNSGDFDIFIEIAAAWAKKNKKNDVLKKIVGFKEKGFLNPKDMKNLFSDKVINQMRSGFDGFSSFDFKNLNFSIVRKGGPYDLNPSLKFEY